MPSINDGLFAGRSGIQSHGTAIAVVADNVANANTTGFKSSRADFVDILAGNLSGAGSATAVGSGSSIGAVTQVFSQGSFEFTGRGLDLGIDGNGFFIVQDNSGTGQQFYTRAGNMSVDADGNLLNQNGYQVQGFPAGGSGGIEALNVNQISQSSVATSLVEVTGNLNASSTPTTLGAPVTAGALNADFDTFTELTQESDFSTFVDVFDSLGDSHTATVYFIHRDTADSAVVGSAGLWSVVAVVDGGEVAGGTAGVPELIGNFDMDFSTSGTRLGTVAATDFTAAPDPTWANGTTSSIGFSFDPFTQFSTASTVNSITQDGTGGGSVTAFSVDSDGSLFARLDNGRTADIGTIALATFGNIEGLRRVGDSLYAESTTSGEPVVGNPGVGIFGGIQGGAVELSTADIASDFIKLISLQRGFQGSSRMITNIDDLLNEIISLA